MDERSSYTVVVVYLHQLEAGEWSFDEALAIWRVQAGAAEIAQLAGVLAEMRDREGIGFTIAASSDVPDATVEQVVKTIAIPD